MDKGCKSDRRDEGYVSGIWTDWMDSGCPKYCKQISGVEKGYVIIRVLTV